MRDPLRVIRRPVLTEKSTKAANTNRTYMFVVDREATKPEIRHAVEVAFKVKVEDVRTCVVKGKRKRMRNMRIMGQRKDWKKAYVKLLEGQRLDII